MSSKIIAIEQSDGFYRLQWTQGFKNYQLTTNDDKINSDNFKFISNNVKGMQKSEKRMKAFEYSSVDDEKRWCDELNGNL